ncbi:MAG: acyltransferase [Rhodothermales bacterium]
MNDIELKNIDMRDVTFGKNVTVVQPANLYGCVIDDGVFIGPFVEIQKKTAIGKNTRIQSHAFICELVQIGADCFIGHGVMFVNDTFSTGKPARGEAKLWKPATIDDNVYIGSNATILPVSICSDVVIGAGAVVTKNITKPGKYAGNPARKLS